MKKITASLYIILSIVACSKDTVKEKPNVLIIYADDLGYGDVSAYGLGTLQTPNIDALAEGGIRFTNAYASSATCSPSRYALLTGKYPWKNKRAKILSGDAPMLIDSSAVTLADMFKSKAYQTAVIGKWHLGLGSGNINWNEDISITPNDIGFDYSYIMAATNDRTPTVYIKNRKVKNLSLDDPLFVSHQENFEGEPTAISNPELMTKMKWHHGHNNSVHNGIPRIGYMKGGKSALWVDEDMADEFIGEAKSFISENTKKKQPFFLFYTLHQPHVPRVPNERFVGKSGMGPRGDAILEADWCVGEIMKHLENEGILENTLVIFSSDNGPVLNDGYYDDAREKIGDHTPWGNLRGGKYSLFEAGTKVPTIVSWKGKVSPQVSNALVSQIDFSASLAALINSDIKFEDSMNFIDTFLGENEKGRDHIILEAIGRIALRSGNYAYIPVYKGVPFMKPVYIETGVSSEPTLYDLKNDPSQMTNIAEDFPEIVEEFSIYLEKETEGFIAAKDGVILR